MQYYCPFRGPTWRWHLAVPLKFKIVCLSQTLRNPECWSGDWPYTQTADLSIHMAASVWSITRLGFNRQRGVFGSKPKRYRTDRDRNVCATRSSVRHGFWALKIQATSKAKCRTMSKWSRSNRDKPPCILRSFGPNFLGSCLCFRGLGDFTSWNTILAKSNP